MIYHGKIALSILIHFYPYVNINPLTFGYVKKKNETLELQS